MYAYTTQVGGGNLQTIELNRLHIQRSEHRLRWLMLARVNLNAVLVERPERVPEQTRRVILFLERDEALPVLAERGRDPCGWFATSEELRMIVIVSDAHITACVLTDGKEPPAATGLIVSRSHCEGGEERRGGGRSVPSQQGGKETKTKKNSHVFGARNTTRIINTHFPLV